MATKLNQRGFDYAKQLIDEDRVVLDDRDAWSEHQPNAFRENEFIRRHGIHEYGRWHLGVDDEKRPETKAHYKYPYGDFADVHRCTVVAAESRAWQYRHLDVERAAAHLHGMLASAGHAHRR